MIQLQADPLIEWDETKLDLNAQTNEAQSWVSENITSTDPVETTETVHSVVENEDWTRPKTQLYTALGFTLDIARTYTSVETAICSATYTLNTI